MLNVLLFALLNALINNAEKTNVEVHAEFALVHVIVQETVGMNCFLKT